MIFISNSRSPRAFQCLVTGWRLCRPVDASRCWCKEVRRVIPGAFSCASSRPALYICGVVPRARLRPPMYLHASILIALASAALAVPLWGQCGGQGHAGEACDPGGECAPLNVRLSKCSSALTHPPRSGGSGSASPRSDTATRQLMPRPGRPTTPEARSSTPQRHIGNSLYLDQVWTPCCLYKHF